MSMNKRYMLAFDFGHNPPVNKTVTTMTAGAIRTSGGVDVFAVCTPYSIYTRQEDGTYEPRSYDEFIHKFSKRTGYQLRLVKSAGSFQKDTIDPKLIEKANADGMKIIDVQILFPIEADIVYVDGKKIDLPAMIKADKQRVGCLADLFAAGNRYHSGMRVYFDTFIQPEGHEMYAGRPRYTLRLYNFHVELVGEGSGRKMDENTLDDLLKDTSTTKFDPANMQGIDVDLINNIYGGGRLVAPTTSVTATTATAPTGGSFRDRVLRNRTSAPQQEIITEVDGLEA